MARRQEVLGAAGILALAGMPLLAACGPKPHAGSASQIPPFLETPVAKRVAASAATVEQGRLQEQPPVA